MSQTILHIDASATINGSVSRAATASLITAQGDARIIRRDLAATPLPQITGDWVAARLVAPDDATDADKALLKLSDEIIAEVKAADTIIIGLPIYNFGMPAALKAWVDLLARPGVTFRYGENGPVGLLGDTKVIFAVASGGTAIGSPMDFATPHLAFFLGFVGITNVSFVNAGDLDT